MKNDIPQHLQDILETRPSSYEKLNLVFHDLSIEDQIFIIKFKKESTDEIAYLRDEFLLNALKSKNAYIRYLISESIYFSSGDSISMQEIKKIIEKDKNDLVRNSLLERDWIWPYSTYAKYYEINNFLKLSQSERLACVRKVTSGYEHVATLFSELAESLKKEKIDEISVFEILSEFSKNKDLYKENWRSNAYEIHSVMETAKLFPDNISWILLEHLPLQSSYMGDFLNDLSESDLKKLMDREDFSNTEFRQKYFYKKLVKLNTQLFNKDKDDKTDSLRLCSSTLHNFSLNEDIINELLKLKGNAQEAIEGLIDYSAINLGETEILKHLAQSMNIDLRWSTMGQMKKEKNLEEKIKKGLDSNLEEYEIEKIINEALGCLTAILSGRLIDKKIPEKDSLFSYNKYVVEGDVWKTYIEIMSTNSWLPLMTRVRICETLTFFKTFYKFDKFLASFT